LTSSGGGEDAGEVSVGPSALILEELEVGIVIYTTRSSGVACSGAWGR
jgi:hypothetical protein